MLLKIPEGLSKTVGDSFMSPANRNTTTMLQQPIDRSNLPIGISPSLDKTAATQPSLGRNPVFEGYSAYPGNKHTPVFSGKETNLTQMFDRTLNRQQETITGVFTTPGRIVRPVNADGTPFTVLSPKTIEVLRTTAELRSATAELKSSAPTVVPPSLPGNVDRATSQRVHGVVVPSDNVIHNLRTAGIPSPIHPTAQIHSLSTLRPSETPLAKNALSPTGMLHVEALLVRNGHKISTLTPATIQTIHGIHTLTPSLAQTLSGRHGTFVTQMTARGEILPGTSHGATKAEPGTVHTQHTQRTEMTDKTAPGNREVRLPGDKTPIGRDVRIGLPVLILNGDRKGAIATRGTQPGDKSAGVVGDKVQSGIKPTAVIGDKTQPGGKTPIGEKAQPGGKAPIGEKAQPGGKTPIGEKAQPGGKAPIGDKKQPGEKDGKIVRPIVDLTFLGGQRVIETGKGTKPFIARRIDEKVTPGVRLPDKDVRLPEKDISKWLEEKLKNNDRKIPNSKDNKTTDGKVVEGKFVRQIDKSAGRITDNSTWQGDNVRERRLKYFVKRGDTLESIAANKLGDRRFATLLLTINRDNMNTDLQSGKQVHTLKEGAVLVLPTLSELRLHREVFFGSKQGTQTSEIKEDKKPGEKQEEREPQESFKWKDEDDESDKREVGNFLKRLRIAGNRRPVSLGVMTGSTNSNRREYHVRLGDTLRSICLRVIGDAGLWPLLARVNNMPETTNGNGQPSIHLKRGDVIQLPNEDEVEYYRFLKSLEQRCIAERTTSGATPPPQPLAPISVSIDQLGNHCRMVAAERFGANFDSNTRLQTSLLGGWTTIACYETRLGQSSRFVYQKDGTQLQYKLDLPAKVIREMAAEDFKRNYNGYLATFIQAESRFQTSSVGNFLMQSPGPSAAVM
jgi:hypothetical protein